MPPVIGTSSARHASPMPSTACANCHMIAGPLGIAEVQAVGRGERPRAGAGDVARRFGDREHRAALRIEIAVAAVAVDRHRQRAVGPLDAHDAGAQARQVDGVGLHHVVVLAVDPLLAGDRRRREQRQQRVVRRRAGDGAPSASRSSCCTSSQILRLGSSAAGRPAPRRSARDSESRRRPRRGPSRAACRRRSPRRCARRADPTCRRSRSTSASRPRFDDEQHALLRLGQHDFVRRHAGLALRHERRRRSRRRRRRAIPSRSSSRSARRRPCPGCRRARRSASPRGTPRAAASP